MELQPDEQRVLQEFVCVRVVPRRQNSYHDKSLRVFAEYAPCISAAFVVEVRTCSTFNVQLCLICFKNGYFIVCRVFFGSFIFCFHSLLIFFSISVHGATE